MKFKNFINELDNLNIIVISDTHNEVVDITDTADVIVHCGDYCDDGTKEEFLTFVEWYSKIDIKHKILSPGNHDYHGSECKVICKDNGIIYLEDSSVIINNTKFYGAPWTEICDTRNFDIEKDETYIQKWNMIDEDTNILLTHSPAWGIRDHQQDNGKEHIGSKSLLKRIKDLPKLKAHFFGHVHGPSGITDVYSILRVNGAYAVNKKYFKVKI